MTSMKVISVIMIILLGVILAGVASGHSFPRSYQEAWIAVAIGGWACSLVANLKRR